MDVRKKYFIMIIIACILCINISSVIAHGANDNGEKKVIMLIINRVDFFDLYSMPQMKEIIDNGSIALMNTRASGGNSEFKSYATLGWGIRAEAAQYTSTFFDIKNESLSIYERRVGNSLPEKGIINTEINRLLQQNMKGEYGAIPGRLGDLLRSNGYKTAVIGNSNTEDYKHTAVGLIAMDGRGYIDYGTVEDNIVEKDIYSPYGIKTKYQEVLNIFKNIYLKSDFIVIETGDTNRLDRYKENLNNIMYEIHKREILNEIDNFTRQIIEHIDIMNTTFIIVTPYPSDAAAIKGDRLTPVIIYNGGKEKGLLWSGTTRRTGIIGNVDIAPNVLSSFQLNAGNMIGRSIITVEKDNAIEFIHELNKRVVNTSVQRYRVLYSFAIFQIFVSIAAFLTIIFRKKIDSKVYMSVSLVLLCTIVAPFTLLVLPIFGVMTISFNYLLLISITLLLVMAIYFLARKDPLKIMILSTAFIVVGLMLDIMMGQTLIQNSLLGYDPIIGARYYGIGNEYMGVLIGATLIFSTALMEKYNINKYYIMFLYVLSIITIAFPTLGANVGGALTAATAYSFTSIRLLGMRITLKKISYILVFILTFISILSIIDLFLIQQQSHLAGAIEQLFDQGPIVIYQIITRKIAMNIRVMGVTVWSRVLLSGMVILGILFYRPVGVIKRIASKYSTIAIGWTGIIVSCIISFFVNDSGVVAAATTIMFLTTSILYLIIDAVNEKS